MSEKYLKRAVEEQLSFLMGELPAILVVGPRAAGKTTLARRHTDAMVRLDRPAEAAGFRADPDGALQGLSGRTLLDEWQEVPELLGAVKRAVDETATPGRFLLTGSVRAELQARSWPGTGRLLRLALYGLTLAEHLGRGAGLLDRLETEGVEAALDPAGKAPTLRDYLAFAMRSGFPEPALRLGDRARRAWLRSYVDQLLTRDVRGVDGGRDPDRLRRFLTAYATQSGQIVDEKTLYQAAGINRKTAQAYEQLLKNLFVIEWIPAWSTNLLKRLVKTPRRVMVEPALTPTLLGLDLDGILRRGEVLGPLLETFVAAQLRGAFTAMERPPRLFHLRTQGGRHEVDLLIEFAPDRLLCIEVKASAAPSQRDARHLAWARDRLGQSFLGGLVLHTGPAAYRLDRGIVAAPIASLWGGGSP